MNKKSRREFLKKSAFVAPVVLAPVSTSAMATDFDISQHQPIPEVDESDLLPIFDTTDQVNKNVEAGILSDFSTSRSWTQGNIVCYNPQRKGGFLDGQDALNHVPAGGTLRIVGTWDTAIEGTIFVERGITVEGVGWSREFVGNAAGAVDKIPSGSKIINSTQNNAISIDAPPNGGNPRIDHSCIRDIYIEHTNPGYPAIRVDTVLNTVIERVMIDCQFLGAEGIRFAGSGSDSFFISISDCIIRDWSNFGIQFQGEGGANYVNNCFISSSASKAKAAASVNQDIKIIGGQLNCSAGTCLLIYNDGGGGSRGGSCEGTWFEHGVTAVKISGDAGKPWRDFNIINPVVVLRQSKGWIDTLVNFDNAIDCHLINPSIGTNINGVLANFGANADACSVLTLSDSAADSDTIITANVTATRCVVKIPEATNAQINTAGAGIDANIDQRVRVEIGHNPDQNIPVFREAGSWYRLIKAGFNP